MISIAVIISVHNRKTQTIKCLQSLFDQNSFKFKCSVFLTDDGSTDGTSEIVSKLYPQVNIIQGNGNLFWNRGMHLAWQTAARKMNYDYYLWLNDDTMLIENALSTLINCSEEKMNQNIIVGTTCSPNDQNKYTYGGRDHKGKLISPTHYTQHCQYFNGNIVLLPSYVFQRVGFNDPVFHHALGDFDYGLRARKLKINSYVAPGIQGTCSAHESLPVWCNPKKDFKVRWKVFRTPLGHNPEEFFIFEKRHNGIFLAIIHYLTNHLRVFYPQLWLQHHNPN